MHINPFSNDASPMPSIKELYDGYYRDEIAGSGRSLSDEPTFRRRVSRAIEALRPHSKVLDFGCGTGQASRVFASEGHLVTGVDISRPAIAYAQEHTANATFVSIDSEERLPFPDRLFSACYCSEVIEHLFDIDGFLAEINRVLEPRALFLLTTPYHGWVKNVIIAMTRFDKHFDPTGEHIRFFCLP